MSAQASTSGSAPPIPAMTHPSSGPSTTSLSPTVPSTSSTRTSPSIPSSLSPSLPVASTPETARQIAEARAYLEASMSNIGSSLDRTLQSRAQTLHDNSKQLEKQQKDLIKATEGLKKENEKLAKELREGSRRVKELGNVQNWAEMMEREFLVLGETLRLVREGSESEWESTGSEGSYFGRNVEEMDGSRAEVQTHEEMRDGKSKEHEEPLTATTTDTAYLAHQDMVPRDADGDLQMMDTRHNALHEEALKGTKNEKNAEKVGDQDHPMTEPSGASAAQDEELQQSKVEKTMQDPGIVGNEESKTIPAGEHSENLYKEAVTQREIIMATSKDPSATTPPSSAAQGDATAT